MIVYDNGENAIFLLLFFGVKMQFSSLFFSGENGNLDLEKKIKMGKDIYNFTFLVGIHGLI